MSESPSGFPAETSIEAPSVHRERRRRKRTFWQRLLRRVRHTSWGLVFLTALVVLAVLAVGVLVVVTNARNKVEDSWQSLSRVIGTINQKPGTELTLADFERLQTGVDDLLNALQNATAQTSFLRFAAGLNEEWAQTFLLLDAAQELGQAASTILAGVEPTLFFLTGGESAESMTIQVSAGERIVEQLRLGQGQFVSAQQHLHRVREILAQFSDVSSVTWLSTVRNLGAYTSQLENLNAILLNGPGLLTRALGLDAARNYLVLAQNSDEIRPAGGYISTYGWLEVRNARIIDYDYSPTTERSPIPPSERTVTEFAVPAWWLQYESPIYAAWDGSWSPDFPTTAEMAAWYYDSGRNPHAPVNGVIAIDTVGFEYILEGLGTVVVPGYQEIVTAENFREMVYKIRAEGAADLEHKRFLAALYRQILGDWQRVDRTRGVELVGAVLRALQEKHIMLYFRDDAALNQAVDILGWSGRQQPAIEHDYVLVADANIGASKIGQSVVRHLTYDANIQADGAVAGRLTVSYDYFATVAESDPAIVNGHYLDIDYDNLLQVFVPASSTLIGTDNVDYEVVTSRGDAHTAFVVKTHVAYNSGERFQFLYNTPPVVRTDGPYRHYRLLIQKQPGTRGEAISVQVTLPPGARMVSASPEVLASYELERQILEFRVTLETDRWIEVYYTTN